MNESLNGVYQIQLISLIIWRIDSYEIDKVIIDSFNFEISIKYKREINIVNFEVIDSISNINIEVIAN